MLDAYMTNFLYFVVLTLVPGVELRGGIPLGIALGFDTNIVFLTTLVLNIGVIYPAFVFLDLVVPPILKHFPQLNKFLDSVQRRSKKYIDRYGTVGLAIFVAIPLPGSGAYSGVLAAYLLKIDRRKSFLAISVGVLVAAVVVTALSLGAVSVANGI